MNKPENLSEEDESEEDGERDHCNCNYDQLGAGNGRNRSVTVSNVNLHKISSNLLHSQSSGGLSRWLFEKQARLRNHHSALTRSFSSQFDRLSIRQYNNLTCTCLTTETDQKMTNQGQNPGLIHKQSLASRRGFADQIYIKVDSSGDKENDTVGHHSGEHCPTASINQLQLPVPFSVVRSISCDTALTEAPTSLMQFKVSFSVLI